MGKVATLPINDKAEFQLPVVNYVGSSDSLPKINDTGNKKSCKFEIELKKKLNTKSGPMAAKILVGQFFKIN
jgi:hypothetical protein